MREHIEKQREHIEKQCQTGIKMGATASTGKRIKPISAEDEVNVLQQQISKLQNELQSCTQQNDKLQQQLESIKQEHTASLLHSDHQLLSQLHDEIKSGKQPNTQLQQQIENSTHQIAQLQQQLESGKQQNVQLQQQVENDQPVTSQFSRAISDAAQLHDEAFMREVFERHATNKKLSANALITALKDVAAPLLAVASCESDSVDYIFRRADANLSGDIDFAE